MSFHFVYPIGLFIHRFQLNLEFGVYVTLKYFQISFDRFLFLLLLICVNRFLVMIVVRIGVREVIQQIQRMQHLSVHQVHLFHLFSKKKKRKVFLNRFYSNKSIVRSSCLCIFCYNGNFVNNWFMSNIDGSFVFCCIDVNVHHRFFFLFNFDFEEHRTFCFSILEIFLSATIGLFAGKGKTSHIGYLSSAWWLALVALIIAFITAIALLILSFYILPPSTSSTTTTINEQNKT